MKISYSLLLAFGLSTSLFAQKENPVDALISEGVNLHDAGDYQGAIEKYSDALEIDEDNSSALYERAFSYAAIGKCDQAISDYKAILEQQSLLNPKFSAQVYQGYANCLDDLGKSNEAISVFREAIDNHPENFLLHYNLGITLLRINQLEEAENEMMSSLNINPGHASSNYFLAVLLENRNGSMTRSLTSEVWFLLLENSGERSDNTFDSFLQRWQRTVKIEDEKTSTISLSMFGSDSPQSDEAFTSSDLMIGLSASMDIRKPLDSLLGDKANRFEEDMSEEFKNFVVYTYSSMTAGKYLSENEHLPEYYQFVLPLLNELAESEHFPAACYLLANGRMEEATSWVKKNEAKIHTMATWVGQAAEKYLKAVGTN
ncbi:MAG: tetratricopeptide repeat protein [Bacteroidetes bacterium]|nr:MAG: tetratricopeptide repeat protein [Bacteroidota bacterium]